ncbi:MAG: DUF167 domain-containing protein [Patescibacteria group bacterium]
MIINIRVKTGAQEQTVVKNEDGSFSVRVKSRPEKGRANKEAIEALAEYFDLPKSAFYIIRGKTSSQKVIKIGD